MMVFSFLALISLIVNIRLFRSHIQKPLSSLMSSRIYVFATVNETDLQNHKTIPKYEHQGNPFVINLSTVEEKVQTSPVLDTEYLVLAYSDHYVSHKFDNVDWCPGVRCRVSENMTLVNKADAVVVHAVDIPRSVKPFGTPNQFWVFHGRESPVYMFSWAKNQPSWTGRFNWTMTYRLDSDIPDVYGKLTYNPNPHPINFTAVTLNKTRPIAWFVSHCLTHGRRELYVKELQKYIEVDIYGRCGMKVEHTSEHNYTYKHSLLDTYKFYLSFENSLCIDYVTEKLFDMYSVSVIPIVRGGFDYKKYIPEKTYINTDDFASPRDLAKYLLFLDENITAYSQILERKHRYGGFWLERFNRPAFCELCKKLQGRPKKKTYSNISDWLSMSGKACHLPQ